MVNVKILFIALLFISCTEKGKIAESESVKENLEVLKTDSITQAVEVTQEIDNRTSVHKHWEEFNQEKEVVSGELIWASDDTGLPYWHNFSIKTENGDTITFNFEGGEYSGEFIGYKGLKCTVDYITIDKYYQIELAEKNAGGKFEVEQHEYFNENYESYDSFVGIYHAEDVSGDLPSEFYVASNNDTLKFQEFLDEEDVERSGEEVKIYYRKSEKIIATKVVFPEVLEDKNN